MISPTLCLSKTSSGLKQHKTTGKDLLLWASIVMPISAPQLLSSPVLLCICHGTICHHHASIHSPRQQSPCSMSCSIITFVSMKPPCPLSTLDTNVVTVSHRHCKCFCFYFFPCVLTRFHVKHLETLITACPINLHSDLPLWQSCH